MVRLVLAVLLALTLCSPSFAKVTGEYLESRTCDVYTGPCFANGEMTVCGREAVMAWKIDNGSFDGVNLAGLQVAAAITANDTLGLGGTFKVAPHPIKGIVYVDEKATSVQQAALVGFVKSATAALKFEVLKVQAVPMSFTADHVTGKGKFRAGEVALIETRGMEKGDCICSNEQVFYPPLVKVENSQPAFTTKTSFSGAGLNSKWQLVNRRSGFMATFTH